MMRKKVVLWVAALMVFMMSVNAYAIPIHMEEGSLVVEAVVVTDVKEVLPEEEETAPEEEAPEEEASEEEVLEEEVSEEEVPEEEEEAPEEDEAADEEAEVEGPYTIDAQDFHILTRATDGTIVLFANGEYVKVTEEALADVVEQVGAARIDSLPRAETMTAMKRGSKGDEVKALQDTLKVMGYLTGTADGSYGGQSERAISAFEKEMGLRSTGKADELLQLLIASVQEEVVTVVAHFDPADRYAAIVGKTSANLNAVAEYGLMLDYDDIEGVGTLGNRAVIAVDASADNDIDSYGFEVQFVLLVRQNDDGEVTVEPGVQLRCECVRRPIMQQLILKSGDARCVVPIASLQNSLSGAKSIEMATAVLDETAVQLLANAAEEGELKFRIGCKYRFFDGEVDEGILPTVSDIGKAAQGL